MGPQRPRQPPRSITLQPRQPPVRPRPSRPARHTPRACVPAHPPKDSCCWDTAAASSTPRRRAAHPQRNGPAAALPRACGPLSSYSSVRRPHRSILLLGAACSLPLAARCTERGRAQPRRAAAPPPPPSLGLPAAGRLFRGTGAPYLDGAPPPGGVAAGARPAGVLRAATGLPALPKCGRCAPVSQGGSCRHRSLDKLPPLFSGGCHPEGFRVLPYSRV
jgi:hypothetical protein